MAKLPLAAPVGPPVSKAPESPLSVVAPAKRIFPEANVRFPPPVNILTWLLSVIVLMGALSSKSLRVTGTPNAAACTF